MKSFRQIAALMAAAVICCSAAALTGCANRSNAGSDEPIPGTIYAPTVPDNPISDDEPGKELDAAIGETVNYDNKVDVTVDQVIEIDDVNKQIYRVLCAEMTITNKSDQPIDCSTLTHFSTMIDDVTSAEPVRDVQAAVAARKYYTKISSDLESFNQKIEAGQTVKGYVYIYAPTAWKELKLVYTPYKYYSNDTVVVSLEEGKFVHYSDSIG